MSQSDPQADARVAAYRAELRTVGRMPRLAGFGLVLLGAILVWSAGQAGDFGPTVQMAGYVALGGGWAMMLAAIFLRTRHHRRRMAQLDGDAQ